MNKYPVTSAKGNEYLVDMGYGTFGFLFVDVCVPYVGLFGREKFRKVNDSYDVFDASNYDYNYVRIAKRAVEKHEETLDKVQRIKSLKAEGERNFVEWDGDCR